MRKWTVYVLSISITSYFCLNTAQYIHVVVFNGYSRVLEKFVRISGVYVHKNNPYFYSFCQETIRLG